MKNFKTYNLAVDFYKKCESIQLKAPMKDQFARASLSVVLNLAEGSGKPTAKDRKKFYRISLGSLREVQAILSITNQSHLEPQADKLGAHIYKLWQNT